MAGKEDGPSAAQAAVLQPSESLDPVSYPTVKGPNLEEEHTLDGLLSSFATIGFQASGVAKACEIIEKMRRWRLSDLPVTEDEDEDLRDEEKRRQIGATIFLGFTSNLISSGLREVIVFLVKHKLVSAIVTTAGGIEEDIIKCLGTTHIGAFNLDGSTLRKKGLNRIGNLLVPNDNYCKFEDWVMPILESMRQEQGDDDVYKTWSPSAVCERLGKEINDESSFLYWAAKNQITVFCPALTDGSLGDMLYFHSYKSPGLVIDLVKDIRKLNDLSIKAKKAGMIILGGGVCKHQIANAMLFRNGADYAVYINTGQEFDGSDSGARPDEAISWGKIKSAERGGENVKVYCDATIIFPLIVANTFAKAYREEQQQKRSANS